ncbi:TatD DNase domain-containing 1, isoform CRA_a, partial [Rozella allomycis CSF55]
MEIAFNASDQMYKGVYHGKQQHQIDLDNVIERALVTGVNKILFTATNVNDVVEGIEYLEKNDAKGYARITAGVHPTNCNEFIDCEDYCAQKLKEYFSHPLVAAVGEFGLDYDRLQFCDKDVQIKYFKLQLDLLPEGNEKPLFLHCRNASKDLLAILTSYKAKYKSGVIHSFDGTLEDALEFIKLGFFIGINGCSLKTEDNLKVV